MKNAQLANRPTLSTCDEELEIPNTDNPVSRRKMFATQNHIYDYLNLKGRQHILTRLVSTVIRIPLIRILKSVIYPDFESSVISKTTNECMYYKVSCFLGTLTLSLHRQHKIHSNAESKIR